MSVKSVLITRPENQSKSFRDQLEKENFKVSQLPLIQLSSIPENNDLEKAFENLERFDWIVFTSVNAVTYFFEAAEKYGVKFYFYPNLKIATVGEKTKLQLEQLGYRTNFVPIKYTAEVLADNMDDVKGKQILIPRSSKASDHYLKVFTSRGATPTPVTVYENKSLIYEAKEFTEIMNQGVDYLTFASSSAVIAFDNNLKLSQIKLKQEKVICIGPSTAKVAESLGYKVAAIAEPHTTEGIVTAIKKHEEYVQTT